MYSWCKIRAWIFKWYISIDMYMAVLRSFWWPVASGRRSKLMQSNILFWTCSFFAMGTVFIDQIIVFWVIEFLFLAGIGQIEFFSCWNWENYWNLMSVHSESYKWTYVQTIFPHNISQCIRTLKNMAFRKGAFLLDFIRFSRAFLCTTWNNDDEAYWIW